MVVQVVSGLAVTCAIVGVDGIAAGVSSGVREAQEARRRAIPNRKARRKMFFMNVMTPLQKGSFTAETAEYAEI
jgi:hypothetical protein